MAPHSLLTRHLSLASIVPLFPKDIIKTYIFEVVVSRFGKNGACYLDLWPFAEPFLVITSPHLANQVTSPPVALERSRMLCEFGLGPYQVVSISSMRLLKSGSHFVPSLVVGLVQII